MLGVVFGLFQLSGLLATCSPEVAPETMAAVVEVESGGNPLAIGVVGARLKTPPATLEEAVATAEKLEALGKKFSVGVAQVNRKNLEKLGLSYEQAFDPCQNLRAASQILVSCYQQSRKKDLFKQEQEALNDALSCYYSGNFERGKEPGAKGGPSYVEKVRAAARPLGPFVVPSAVQVQEQRISWPFGGLPVLPAPVAVEVAPAKKPVAEESALLVSPSACRGVMLGSPCSSPASEPASRAAASASPPAPSPAPTLASPSERKEAPTTKPARVF